MPRLVIVDLIPDPGTVSGFSWSTKAGPPMRLATQTSVKATINLGTQTPFNLVHLRNMTAVTEMGAVVFPPLPAFYHRPSSIDELVDETVERALELLGIAGARPQPWNGLKA